MLMLKTVLDFKEHQQAARHSVMHGIPIEQYAWKRGQGNDA